MKLSAVLFLLFAVAAAAVCIRLGLWQLDRRDQRLAMNARILGRYSAEPVPIETLSGDTTTIRFTRAIVSGTPDFANEVILTHRGNDGAPGVDILTPVRVPGTDSAIIVNRGWVYSPDAMSIERDRWREPDTTFVGYIDSFESNPADTIRAGGIRRLSYEAIARAVPYPLRRFHLVALGDSVAPTGGMTVTPRIVRLKAPKLDDGPHLSYAFQWFGFATIALAGAGIVTARSMRMN